MKHRRARRQASQPNERFSPTSELRAPSPECQVPSSEFLKRCELPLRPWLLAAMTALFVARPLVPSEGVAWLGDGQPFCMLWLLAALGTTLAAIKAGGLPRGFGWLELLVGLFIVLHSLAALRGASIGNSRPAINMLWEGMAMAVSFLLVRQLVRTARESRALVVVMIALAAVLSAYGLYQVFVGMPADRADYARDPEGVLRAAGQWYPRGSQERAAFENRLNSSEPLATFALTNSLGGYLATWLVISLGIALRLGSTGLTHSKRLFSRVPIAAILALVSSCLLLTKSRSAYVACAVGVVAILAAALPGRAARYWKPMLGGLVLMVAIAGLAFTAGGLDSQIVTEAGKSLGYRLQYWQSTTAMIGDRPLLGVGPGNFQDFYTRYKLPAASEEIREPHNWIFEIAATAGLPALVAFCLVIGVACSTLMRAKSPVAEAMPALPVSDWSVFGGAGLGFVVALIAGPIAGLPLGFEKLAGGLLVGGAAVLALRSWVHDGAMSPSLPTIGMAVLLVHLLAAGGIMYPAVAGSFWLLLGLGLNLAQPPRPLPGKRASVVACVVCAAIAVSQYLTGYAPVLRSQGALMEAENSAKDPLLQEQALMLAAEADRFAAEPWHSLAALKLRIWREHQGERALEQFGRASAQFLTLKPHSSSAFRSVGNDWRQVFEKTHASKHAEAAVAHLSRAVDLYPNHASVRADLALALADARREEASRREAAKALELDAATPHADKRLPDDLREEMATIVAFDSPGSR